MSTIPKSFEKAFLNLEKTLDNFKTVESSDNVWCILNFIEYTEKIFINQSKVIMNQKISMAFPRLMFAFHDGNF